MWKENESTRWHWRKLTITEKELPEGGDIFKKSAVASVNTAALPSGGA
jgi:hypothetical protein